jgi:hypothetical protein
MTIFSYELATTMTGPPAEGRGAVSISIGQFSGKEMLLYFSLGSPTAGCCCCELAASMTFYETSRIITTNKRNNVIRTGYLVYLSSPTLSLPPIGQANS